jgi:YggT family protein
VEAFVVMIFTIYRYMVFAYIIMSWLPNLRESAIGELLGKFVEPFLAPFKKVIPPLGMIDISPIVALIALYFAQLGAVALIRGLGF